MSKLWLYLAGAVVFIAALAGLVHEWGIYTAGLERMGYNNAVAQYTKRDNAQLQTVIAQLKAAEVRAKAAEDAQAAALTIAHDNYTKGVQDEKERTAAHIAAIRAGTLRLRDPGRKSGGISTCGSYPGPSATVSAGSGHDEAAQAGLSTTASEFLLYLTGEADEVTRQLALCQARVVSDMRVCNASP